jgi:phosphate starvation-inducible protein PhoH and related proteins
MAKKPLLVVARKKVKAKHKSDRVAQVAQELEIMEHDLEAQKEGPRRKTWSHHDITTFRPVNARQTEALESWVNGDNLALLGSAGTGKTLLACYAAASVVFRRDEKQDRIVIVRSAVESRRIGFLPGTMEEKLAAYEQPYMDALTWLFTRKSTYDDMKAAAKLEFHSTSFLRGVTWDNAVIVLDEVQNMTFHELNTVLTRIGQNSRVIITGDTRQCDFEGTKEESGLPKFLEIVKDIKGFGVIEFNRHDIVRSGFVRSWITAVENYAEAHGKLRKRE